MQVSCDRFKEVVLGGLDYDFQTDPEGLDSHIESCESCWIAVDNHDVAPATEEILRFLDRSRPKPTTNSDPATSRDADGGTTT